jgi:hypothetical protein
VALATITATAAVYDDLSQRYFYADTTGSLTDWYRVREVDSEGNAGAWSAAYRPSTFVPASPVMVFLTEAYEYPPGIDQIYRDSNGDVIVGAQIRVYLKADYDLGDYDHAVGYTTTDAHGRWVNPILIAAGTTYTVYFCKSGSMGPDTKEIIIP